MNPILLGRQVATGLRDLVRSTLNTTSPSFDGTVERFLAEPKNFLQGPWISVAMPFRRALVAREPFPEVPLGFHAYRHQELAFERLGGAEPKSTMIATGTGSGKTESYLWPIFDHCRRHKGEPGIKAILIYPMNALATDQARRIARAIHRTPALQGVRCGIYADAEPANPTDLMSETEVITRRTAMRDNPPDILLTNYKMLDYLLLRGRDRQLWAKNEPETFRFLVVDELHTFDGAQGADLALLIRRLKARLKTPANHLACVGSSATLGSGEETAQKLIAYAKNIFGEPFEPEAVIREDRMTPAEVMSPPEYLDLPDPQEISAALARAINLDQGGAALEITRCFVPDLDPANKNFDTNLPGDPEALEWRIALGNALLEHVAVQRVLTVIAESGGLASLEGIVEGFSRSKAFRNWTPGDLSNLAEAVVSLIAWARDGSRDNPQPLLNVRIQFWVRELARMVADLPHTIEGGNRGPISLYHSDDLYPSDRRHSLPIVNCSRCGTAGHLGRLGEAGGGLWSPIDTLYEEFFSSSQRLRVIYHERVTRLAGATGQGTVVTGYLDSESLRFTPGEHSEDAAVGAQAPVWLYDPTDRNGRIDRTCPACGTPQSLQIFGLRAARLTAALANTLYNSAHNEEDETEKPRLLLFSDSVQDAAQRAAVVEIRNSGTVIRKSIYKAIEASTSAGLTLKEVIEDLPETLCQDLGPDVFVARYIARDQAWRKQYQDLCRSGEFSDDGKLLPHVKLRLGWEYFSDLSYRSHTSQTLEASRLAVAEVAPEAIRVVAERLPAALQAHIASDITLSDEAAYAFLAGLLQHMRRRGAVGHKYVRRAMENYRTGQGLGYFAASRILGVGKTGALPVPNHRRSASPVPPTLRSNLEGYENVVRDHGSNWYRAWADRFFLSQNAFATSRYLDIFAKVFELLEAQSIVRRVSKEGDPTQYGFVIEPGGILVSNRVFRLRCDTCNREEITLADDHGRVGSPCTRIACPGNLEADEDTAGNAHMAGLLRSNRSHRVVAREHTGILDSDDRRALESAFISGKQAWTANLISATPTLEMGIDIGDLSTLLLCSVPPEIANYVQRIGRTGRRDGNSLNLTIANARPHDLQFWEEPISMLAGEVGVPGVYLQAIAVLRRQVAAFTLDRLVASSEESGEYGKVRSVLKTLESGEGSGFPLDWFEFIEKNAGALADEFLALLPSDVRDRPHIHNKVRQYLVGSDDETLIWQARSAFGQVAREKEDLRRALKELDRQQRRLRNQAPPPTDLDDRIVAIKRDKGEINHSIRSGIDEVDVLRFLTDRGILPNYAFPEEGVKLKSILARQREIPAAGGADEDGSNLITREYVRPAAAALSELAPWQTFYADGREVKIDRLDLGARDLSEWRFCQRCTHLEKEVVAKAFDACPKCGDEMWVDSGSVHEAVELKTVIAVTSEQKAAIKDADDRQMRQFDRAMFPFYIETAIEQAYASVNKDRATPFGYEFISTCEFRDFNFGERTSAPVGATIAGEPRHSRPFRVCRHCGKIQTPPREEDDPGEHQPRCIVKPETDRASWEATIFLMRKFSTEAIRFVIPVIGDAEHDDIKSFVAGIELGMRKHFAGKVDHIRNVVVEEQIEGQVGVRSLYLYDSVPGGSGYLRQLAEHPDTLKSVIEKAVSALRDCSCVEEDKDGCFRCVRSYRSQFGPGEPSRDTALALMEDILQHWEHLKKADAGVNNSIRSDLVDSVLERRFLDALRQEFGQDSLKPKLLDGARQAFQLNTKLGGRSSFWTIETQVQIEKRFAGLPRKRVDFLISPASSQTALPIVVEMDGLAYHAETVAEDLETRLLMIRSRKVRVWSLAWNDLSKEENGTVPNPYSESRLGGEFSGVLARIWSNPEFADLLDHKEAVSLLQSGTSMEGLVACLKAPEMRFDQAGTLVSRLAIRKPSTLANLPRISDISEDGRLFLEETPVHGFLTDQTLDLYLGAPGSAPSEALRDVSGYRILLKANLPRLEEDIAQTRGLSDAWRGLWRMVNYLQDLPGFHLEFDGLENLSAPVVSDVVHDTDEEAWLEIGAMVDDGFSTIVAALQAAAVTPPDLIGWDAMVGDAVVGMIELGWSEAKCGLVEKVFELPDWQIIEIGTDKRLSASVVVETILKRLEGKMS